MGKDIKFCNIEIEEIIKSIFGNKKINYKIIGNIELLRNVVVKIDTHNVILKIYGDISRWQREITALSLLGEEKYTPNLYDFGKYKDIGWVIISFVDGVMLNSKFLYCNKKEKQEILYRMGVFLREIHDKHSICIKDKERYVKYEPFILCNSQEYIYMKYLKNKQKILEQMLMNDNFIEVCSYIESNYEQIVGCDKGELTYCHNDYGVRNIIEQEESFILIDFESGLYAEREVDLANIFFDYYEESDLRDSFIEGYSKAGYEINKEKIILYLIIKCIDICSWAKERDLRYFNKAIKVLNDIHIKRTQNAIF